MLISPHSGNQHIPKLKMLRGDCRNCSPGRAPIIDHRRKINGQTPIEAHGIPGVRHGRKVGSHMRLLMNVHASRAVQHRRQGRVHRRESGTHPDGGDRRVPSASSPTGKGWIVILLLSRKSVHTLFGTRSGSSREMQETSWTPSLLFPFQSDPAHRPLVFAHSLRL